MDQQRSHLSVQGRDKGYAPLAELTGRPTSYNAGVTEALMSPQRESSNSSRPAAANAPSFSGSSFERVVDTLKLSPEQYQSSAELREWVLRNKDHKYVPPDLLKAFGFQVNLEP